MKSVQRSPLCAMATCDLPRNSLLSQEAPPHPHKDTTTAPSGSASAASPPIVGRRQRLFLILVGTLLAVPQANCFSRKVLITNNDAAARRVPSSSALFVASQRVGTTASSSKSKVPTEGVIQQLEPRTESTKERRREAMKALNHRRGVEAATAALGNVDPAVLDLFSENFRYPESGRTPDPTDPTKATAASAVTTRQQRRGRPQFVPAAMNANTMSRYLENRDMLELVMKNAAAASPPSNIAPSAVSPSTVNDTPPTGEAVDVAPSSALPTTTSSSSLAPRKSLPKRRAVAPAARRKASSTSSTTSAVRGSPRNGTSGPRVKATVPTVSDGTGSAIASVTGASSSAVVRPGKRQPRKRVVKNLPAPRTTPESSAAMNSRTMALKQAGLKPRARRVARKKYSIDSMIDLQKFYSTELLTTDEEYSLGLKIRFMMSCEEVHEGLATELERLPTMVEWAAACGFTQPDKNFRATEADEQLRPAGSETMFDEVDPSTFVGNGQLATAGPGRGRGRTRKPPPSKLADFYDDSDFREKLRKKMIDRMPAQDEMTPTNRGTPTKFVEMLMTSREAKQRMVQCNMRLVISIARKYANVGVSLQDLVQEGSLGLSRAAEKFEPRKGFKFSTYASWWIQQAVFRSIAYQSRTIRLPVHIHNLLNKIHRLQKALTAEYGRAPTNEEMAAQLGVSVQKFNKTIRLTKRTISLETPKYKSNPKDLGHESDDLLRDTIDAESVLHGESSPQKRVDRGIFYEDLKEMLQILEEDEKRVICARYGLVDGLTRTVTSVAAEMRQSKAWVRSQEYRALRKLRRPWYEKKLKEHEDALSN